MTPIIIKPDSKPIACSARTRRVRTTRVTGHSRSEEGVIDNVPDHRQRREQDTEPAHFNDRTLHEPCGGWGEDQRRQTFKAYRVDYPFRQRFALGVDLLHGLLPPVFI